MKKLVRAAAFSAMALVVTVATVAGVPRSVSAAVSCPTDVMSALTPSDPNYNDSGSVNIGTRFKVNGAPFVRGVKFYKGVDNTGTHVAHLRKVGGTTDLASATFTSETSSGWQTVNFSSDVPLDASGSLNSYVVWVSMPNGHYAYTASEFQYGSVGNPDEDVAYVPQGQSGVYNYTSDDTAVPTNTSYDNYYVTPIVGDSTASDNNSGVSASDATAGPSVGWSGVGYDTSASLSTANPSITQIIRDDGNQSVVIGSQSGGNSTWQDLFSGTQADTTALPGTSYTYTVKNTDYCGNISSGSSSSQIGTASRSLSQLFSTDPGTLDTGQTTPVVVGMHWQTDTAGKVWGARFYRSSGTVPTVANSNGNAAAFKVSLWDNDGTQLASAYVPVGNEQSGWIDVRFASPVDVAANHDYVVGYFTPNGHEVYTNSTFNSVVTNGNLSGRADGGGTPNGVYAAGFGLTADTFPSTASSSATWYGVDVDFYIP